MASPLQELTNLPRAFGRTSNASPQASKLPVLRRALAPLASERKEEPADIQDLELSDLDEFLETEREVTQQEAKEAKEAEARTHGAAVRWILPHASPVE